MKPEQVKAQFEEQGITIRQWATARGFNPRTVYAVLQGEIKGKHGVGHQIAVELGLKKRPVISTA